ncbi:MAG: flavodoxin-dependent (E)-4-hydroxy-3-methylbut-2-enyl-diphosphate synthase [Candidatus Omnitrophota bacterium]|nr:flavodoxin-dependent (E)-4-hydroxy-3-methylbut-2-enyl-diphosphate synthase [Candidatus Omnitrophota bacterium]
MINRKKTRQVNVGGVKIGGGADVTIQSMTKVETADVGRVVSQINALEKCGCDIVRVAVKNLMDAEAVRAIKKRINIPLICDIHFDYRLALKSIAGGADKIRLNPGNMRDSDEIAAVIKAAKKARIPVRIGVNSGSVIKVRGKGNSSVLVDAALGYIKLFEDFDFRDIIISLKASDVVSTVESYRRMAKLCDYPLHLGVTAAGSYDKGIVKSSIGIGALLLDGIGDTIRVSLTGDPVEEVIAGKRILSSLGLRNFGPDVISCPTCGRCQVNLAAIVNELERKLTAYSLPLTAKRPLTIAVMGCEVNGPGEAREADIGIAAGKKSGVLFKNGKIVKRVKESDFVKEILKFIKLKADS